MSDRRGPLAAALFDMDGILIDSEPIHEASLRDICAARGVVYDSALHAGYVGRSDAYVFGDLCARHPALGGDIDALVAARHARFMELVDRPLDPRPGVVAVLDALAASRVPMAVVSTSALAQIERIVANLGLRPYFAELVRCAMVPSPKPAPDVYLLAAERLGVRPARTLVFEDSAPGVGAGVAAGAVTVAVPCPATQAHDLSAAHARFASFEELGGAARGALIGRFFGAA